MDFKYKAVSLSQIVSDDDRFRISSPRPHEDLLRSIEDLGLIRPPILFPVGKNYIVISGFARIAACAQLGWDQITAGLIHRKAPTRQCAIIAIADNTAHRELNIVEQARAMKLLVGEYKQVQDVVAAAQRAGLGLNTGLMAKLKKVDLMSDSLRAGLVEGTISLPVALKIVDINDNQTGLERIVQLLSELNLSLNQQREIVDAILSITRRDNISIQMLVDENHIVKWRQETEIDRRQKAQHIRRYLRKRRYPTITEAEDQFLQIHKQLKLKEGTQLLAPPNFESRAYTLRVEFEKIDELKMFQKELHRLLAAPELERLWELYG